MPVRVQLESVYGPLSKDIVPDGETKYWTDDETNRIIIARCLGELGRKGAEIFMLNNYRGDTDELSPEYVDDLMARAGFRKFLMPWESVDFPARLPNGSKGLLNMLARPVIILNKALIPRLED